jgi:hypothetical protein
MNPFQSLREYEAFVYTLSPPDLSFTAPNLPFLIGEIETTLC